MNHSDIQSRMASYLDGELSLNARALFDAHLDRCDACSLELAGMRDTIRALRALPSPEPPPDLVSNVMRRIAEGEAEPNWFGRAMDQLSRVFVPRFAIPATAVAAALALTVLSGDLSLRSLKLGLGQAGPVLAGSRTEVQGHERPHAALPRPSRVAQVGNLALRAPAEAPAAVRVADPAPPLHYRGETGAGPFLYRVANDQLGPLRRQVRAGTTGGRLLFMSGSPQVGPYLGASAAPSVALGAGASVLGAANLQRGSGERHPAGLMPVALSRLHPATGDAVAALTPEQRRHRELDARLNFLKEDPPGFAQRQAQISLAERELWLRELAARAEEIGEIERVMNALEGSGDVEALSLARDFDLAVKRNRESWAAADAP